MVSVNKILDLAVDAGEAAVDAGTDLFRSIANAFGKKTTDASDVLEMSVGALPTANTAAEDMARKILELRAAGRSDEVTEAMMSAADDPYMFANTPLDMSEAARMARAADRIPVYHRTSKDFDAFDLSESQSGPAIFVGPNAQNLQQGHNRKSIGDNIMPLLLKTNNPLELDEFKNNSVDYIITDPPYGDVIQYSELSFMWNSWLDLDYKNKNEVIIRNLRPELMNLNLHFYQMMIIE